MSIEKMHMVNLVGAIKDFDKLTKMLALEGCMQPVSALQEINSSDFVLKTSTDNIEALMDVNYIRPYLYDKEYNISLKYIEKLKDAQKIFGKSLEYAGQVIFDFDTMETELESVYGKYKVLSTELEDSKEKQQYLKNTYEALEFLKNVSLPMEDITTMKNFQMGLYKVPKENMLKVKANYENIPSIIQSVYEEKDSVIFIAFTPILLLVEAERIFKSANCEKILVPEHYTGVPRDVSAIVSAEINEAEQSTVKIKKQLSNFLDENYETIKNIQKSYELEQKSGEIKKSAACTNEFFYLSGWIPKSFMDKFNELLLSFDGRILTIEKDPNERTNKDVAPPTMLINNKLFKPFESMVFMYGVPSYGEIDPTMFFAITYTLMFGAMFGDAGQGLVLLLAGFLLKNKLGKNNLGGVFERLGISSIVFGFLYGSVFGSETVIPALLIRPMEDINDILIVAIICGCGFLILAFILGITNSLRRKDLERGLFGKEGLAGFMFYIGALTLIVSVVYKKPLLPITIWIIYFIFFLLLILLKQPLANIILGKKILFEDGAKDYFIESSFEVVETLLSMFSNTLSFIRVGAFALNHVGLFVAFSAMASMTKSGFASVLILILGNIVIICLEGLIVFIQGLRLEYYELFSKYYEGAGVSFEPVKIKLK
ncbi:V-type ATP synthase subunit I [Clostridium tagluense]|uniref:V-type ATP synthase subunit I n=1 Tax=Clostridium tagluense TaxID=360422 RepID=A0A401UHU3_9CLOT|nr:V-type ATPase 116kDa subunit family protein [Clostridium tagluense]GCD09120.1 V-type ATP synthase subunit I [Clostridium tagluense]